MPLNPLRASGTLTLLLLLPRLFFGRGFDFGAFLGAGLVVLGASCSGDLALFVVADPGVGSRWKTTSGLVCNCNKAASSGYVPLASTRMLDLQSSKAFIHSSLSARKTAPMSGARKPGGAGRVMWAMNACLIFSCVLYVKIPACSPANPRLTKAFCTFKSVVKSA